MVAQTYAAMFARIAAELEAQYGARLAIDAHALALAVQALAMGVVWQFILSPRDVRRADVIAAFEALANGAVRNPLPQGEGDREAVEGVRRR
jgi:N-formylglutamate amidohydrolase